MPVRHLRSLSIAVAVPLVIVASVTSASAAKESGGVTGIISARTSMGTPVTIDVPAVPQQAATIRQHAARTTRQLSLTGAAARISIFAAPFNGTARVVRATSGGPYRIVYTPNAGFAGIDAFRYLSSGDDGSSTVGGVQVTVPGAPTASGTSTRLPPSGGGPSFGFDPTSATRGNGHAAGDGNSGAGGGGRNAAGGSLADTGAPVAPLVGIGVLLLGSGAGVLRLSRRRRVRPAYRSH